MLRFTASGSHLQRSRTRVRFRGAWSATRIPDSQGGYSLTATGGVGLRDTRCCGLAASRGPGGRQLIVETHSEYLISRLRLRVAEDDTDRVQRTVGLLFAERTTGATQYRRVAMNEFGGIDNWPQDFFDQSTEEAQAILRASVTKRRRQATAGSVEVDPTVE